MGIPAVALGMVGPSLFLVYGMDVPLLCSPGEDMTSGISRVGQSHWTLVDLMPAPGYPTWYLLQFINNTVLFIKLQGASPWGSKS